MSCTSPALAYFCMQVGSVVLTTSFNELKIKGDIEKVTLQGGLITSFMDQLSNDISGLMMRKVNGETYFGVTFNVENIYIRGREDLYLLFTRGNDPLINTRKLEKELSAVANVYADLILKGEIPQN